MRLSLLFGLFLAFGVAARADTIYPSVQIPAQPTSAAELGDAKAIADVEQAIKRFEIRDFKGCLEKLSQAVKARPELPPPHALFAKIAFLNKQGALVRPALERAATEDASHPEVYLLFANLALLENRPTDAAVHIEKARALAVAERWSAVQRHRFERLCLEGDASVAESRGDWIAARRMLTTWLDEEPNNARARDRLGKVLFRLGQPEQAYEELKRAAQEDATLGPAPLVMAWLYTRTGNVQKARQWMDNAVRLLPNSLSVRVSMTSWLLEQGKADEAQTQSEAAARLDPNSKEVKRLLGLAARERKDFARAEAIFQALAQEAPGDAWLRNQFAQVLAEQPDQAKQRRALELAELGVRQNQREPAGLATLGMVYYRLKRLDDAEKILQAVLDSGRANSDAAYFLALIKGDRGQQDRAAELMKTALAAPGLFLYRNDAQQWLQRLPTLAK